MTENVPKIFDLAFSHHRRGKIAEAARLYQKCIDANSQHADAWHLLGLAMHQSGQSDNAVNNIMRAVELDPSRALFQTNLATILNALKRFGEAAAAARRAVELDPADGDAFHHLGVALLALDDASGAEQALDAAVRLQPTNSEFLNNLGVAFKRQGKTGPAEDFFGRALDADPSSITAAVNRAEALSSLGRVE
ncbi:MAG: tetratricopeptide repeat protein, partial [Rhodospirillales bacterium]|nr:tetratricopeptide repeat protein [Rhodospirillales bacterium]